MQQKAEVQACHLIEKDLEGDILWTWSYPKLEEKLRPVYVRKCTFLFQETLSRSQPFHFFHFSNLWVYVHFSEVFSSDKLPQVKQVALVLSSLDFNPNRYETLCRILSKRYCKSGRPVKMLQLFLAVLTSGKCTTDENGTFYLEEFDNPSPFQDSQLASIIGKFGLETILIYTALLLKRRIAVYHHEASDLVKFVMSLPAFLPHRETWNLIYPLVDVNREELIFFQESKAHILGFTNSSIESHVDIYDLYVNIPASEITIAPHARDAITMTKIHKDIAIFMVQLTQKGFSESDIIHNISQKTKELIRNIRSIGQVKDGKTLVLNQLKKNDNSSTMEVFLLSLARAENLTVI